jgi:hypothetical protein
MRAPGSYNQFINKNGKPVSNTKMKRIQSDRSGDADDQTMPLSAPALTRSISVVRDVSVKKKKKRKIPVLSVICTVSQVLFFIWLPSLYISAFAGLGELLHLSYPEVSWTDTWPSLHALPQPCL